MAWGSGGFLLVLAMMVFVEAPALIGASRIYQIIGLSERVFSLIKRNENTKLKLFYIYIALAATAMYAFCYSILRHSASFGALFYFPSLLYGICCSNQGLLSREGKSI
jgi:hypothetical protein